MSDTVRLLLPDIRVYPSCVCRSIRHLYHCLALLPSAGREDGYFPVRVRPGKLMPNPLFSQVANELHGHETDQLLDYTWYRDFVR